MKPINSILFRSLLSTLAIIGAASCTDDPIVVDDNGNDAHRILLPGEYRFIISCDTDPSFKPSSRVSYESIEASRFSTGDHIGVFASNREAQIQNDVFSARNMNDDSEIQVLAPPAGNVTQGLETEIPTEGDNINYLFYYPMNESWKLSTVTAGTGLGYTVETDQSTKENYEKSDFLWNHLAYDGNEEYQSIHMHHLMANIVVKIHKDSIAPDPVSEEKTVTLRNLPVHAGGIYLFKRTAGEMNYSPAKDSRSDIKMYCQGEMGDYLVYRAAIPAWHTLSAGDPIITVNLYDRQGNVEEVTYNLAKDISLKDGFYYTFTLRSAVKPAIPDVSNEDSWVLDVFDPETNEIVGLLCREYLHYQPSNISNDPTVHDVRTTPGNGYIHYGKADQWTGVREITTQQDQPHISSQAWVFYNLQEGSKLPNLKEGTVLRFIYDIIASKSGGLNGDAWYDIWPAPHRYGVKLNGIGDSAQGIFLARHGHEWVALEEGYGGSSKEGSEYYMHGGTITWEKATSDNVEYYYKIGDFTMPEIKIDNNTATIMGHIAIPESGEPYVSYEPFDSETNREIGDPSIKVGRVVEKFLDDQHDGNSYPLIKIGYNNFWMSKSYRTKSLNDGTILTCQNKDGNGSTDYKDYILFQDAVDLLPASYLYPCNPEYFDVFTAPNRSTFPVLYNYTTVKNSMFVPPCQDTRLKTTFPKAEHLNQIAKYLGWKFAAKLLTGDIPTVVNGVFVESLSDALSQDKIIDNTQNSFNCNVSGFNLHTNGDYHPYIGFKDTFGHQCSLWTSDNLGEPYDSQNGPGVPISYIEFNPYDAFNGTTDYFSDGFYHKFDPNYTADGRAVEASQLFFSVRFILKFDGQEDSDEFFGRAAVSRFINSVKSSSRSGAAQAPKRESNLVTVPVIECKE